MEQPLQTAIRVLKTQEALAAHIQCSQSMISYWLSKAKNGVPAEYCIAIERATNSAVTRHDLRPDIYGPAATVPTQQEVG